MKECDMLSYERNKYERLLADAHAGERESILKDIRLELMAIRDIAEYVPEDDKLRIIRRLNRIDTILSE